MLLSLTVLVERTELPQAEGGGGVVRSLHSHSFSPEIFVVASNSHGMTWFYLATKCNHECQQNVGRFSQLYFFLSSSYS